MKKTATVCIAALLFCLTSVKAQGILDKIDNALNKADKAANTADRGSKTGGKVLGFFGKKNKGTEVAAENKTIITLNGATFESLKKIDENVQSCKNVAATKMKFNKAGSTITVSHSGTTEELLKALQKASPASFSEKNLESLDEGEITIKIMK